MEVLERWARRGAAEKTQSPPLICALFPGLLLQGPPGPAPL